MKFCTPLIFRSCTLRKRPSWLNNFFFRYHDDLESIKTEFSKTDNNIKNIKDDNIFLAYNYGGIVLIKDIKINIKYLKDLSKPFKIYVGDYLVAISSPPRDEDIFNDICVLKIPKHNNKNIIIYFICIVIFIILLISSYFFLT